MASIYQYIEKNQSFSFSEKAYSEIDILILNELVYFPMESYIGSQVNVGAGLRLEEFYQQIEPTLLQLKKENWVLTSNARIKLLKAIYQTKRYRDVYLFNFNSQVMIEDEFQFAAMCLKLPSQEILISFRGTDDTLIGWKEDCHMAFQTLVPSQRLAFEYLRDTGQFLTHHESIIVSGHSKGGNLAVYAAAFQTSEIQQSIQAIVSFDGPGFHQSILEMDSYQNIQGKISHFVPEDSIVGMLLFHSQPPIIIKSKGVGFTQHIATNWRVEGDALQRLETRSDLSYLVDASLKEWTIDRTETDLEKIFSSSFDLIFETGIQSIVEVTQNPLQFARLFNTQLRLIDSELRLFLEGNISAFFSIIRSHLVENRRNHYHQMLTKFSDWTKDISVDAKLPFKPIPIKSIKRSLNSKRPDKSSEGNVK